ncbi:MAG: Cell wall hydrolase CwlJ [Firmicutes bacterium ADurb.Bin182]|nr:MAG: Cell wall hydrolase CwlJ [Firmicutes bacterium ADurb.Bin182]
MAGIPGLFWKKTRAPQKTKSKSKRMFFIAAGLLAAVLLFIAIKAIGQASDNVETARHQQEDIVDLAAQGDEPPVMQEEVTSSPKPTPSLPETIPVVEITAAPTPSPEIPATPTPVPTPTPIPVDMDEWIDYYMVEADLYYNDVGYSTNRYEYDDDDVYILAQLIHGEARGESYKGKIAVGNVVMNRVLCRSFPGRTIKEVITAPGQFTGYSSSIKPSSSCKAAARQILEREQWVIPQNVYFFHSNRPEGEDWGSHKFYKKIDGHCFYTHPYSGRNRNGEIPPALFERTFKWPQYGCKPEKRVHRIQYMLNKLGYDVKADSYFGKTTEIALMEFQKKYGLEPDGIAGPSTIERLIKEFGVEKYYERYIKS